MRFWKENRINQEWSIDNKKIAERFIASKFYKEREAYRGTAQALVFFITDKEGLNSSYEWEDKRGSIDGSKDIIEILDIIDEKVR